MMIEFPIDEKMETDGASGGPISERYRPFPDGYIEASARNVPREIRLCLIAVLNSYWASIP